ncbi:MAG: RluA family pseudouridine synthase [Ruminococcaceae bacterium]|nr:RluA family pseudouridine synthase [Oscillospiraceae bacterium]
MTEMNEKNVFAAEDEILPDESPDVLSFCAEEDGERLDSFVARNANISRSQAQRLIEMGNVTIGGKTAAKNSKLKKGDIAELIFPENEDCDAKPENIPLEVVYEDGDIIIVNKPCGMVVHPAPGHSSGTLVNALMYHCGDSLSGIGGVNRPGIVHRIDRDTSGLICAAKNDSAHLSLAAQLQDHTMHREYRMIVVGNLKEDSGTVDAPIGRHPTDRKKMAVIKGSDKRSRYAVTHWRTLERFSGFTYAEAVLETGRTHQIRVHMAYSGHPLMGDTVYGGGHTTFEKHNAPLIDGQMLHATALILNHPRTGEKMRFETPLPENFTEILEKLRRMNQ